MPKRRYPGSIDRHGDRLRVRLCVAGKPHSFTLPTTDIKVAQQFAKAKYAELEKEQERKAAGIRTGVRFSEVVTLYETETATRAPNTVRSYADSLSPIRPYFVELLGDPPVDRIRTADVTAFLTWRRTWRPKGRRKAAPTTPISKRTLQKDRAVLHAVMALAEQQEFIVANVVRRTAPPKIDRRSPVILSDAQFDALASACVGRPMLEMYAIVLGESGLRSESEALWLRWEDIDFSTDEAPYGWLHVVNGRDGHRVKAGESRYVPMTQRLRDALRDHCARFRFAGSPWVFHHLADGPHHKAKDRIQTMRTALDSAVRRAKLPANFHPHDLRHTKLTKLAAKYPLALAQKFAGHK